MRHITDSLFLLTPTITIANITNAVVSALDLAFIDTVGESNILVLAGTFFLLDN